MRTKLRGKFTLLFLTIAVLLAVPAVVALADTLFITNELAVNSDATKNPGDTGTARVYVKVTNGTPDGDTNGCNVRPGNPLTVELKSDNPDVTFPNGDSVQITDCVLDNNSNILTASRSVGYQVNGNSTGGTAVISVDSYSGGRTDGTRTYLTTDTLKVRINPPAKQNQTISFAANTPTTKTYGDEDFNVSATATSGLDVSFAAKAGSNCTVSNSGLVSLTGAGSCTVVASQAGNNNYFAAPDKEHTITIDKATPTIEWNNPADITYGTALSATQLNATAKGVDGNSLAGSFAYNPGAGTVLLSGTKTLNVTFTPTDTNNYNTASAQVQIVVNPYPFTGFFQPIDNNGVFNKAKIGSTIPVRFSLGGDKGLNIFAAGYPQVSKSIACGVNPAVDAIEEYATATNSGLKYDPVANQYIYNWKTDSTIKAGECRQLIVKLADGSVAKTANFTFFK